MRRLRLLPALLILLLPCAAAADTCEEIAKGADAWAALADRIDEIAEAGGPSQAEADELDSSVEEGIAATLELAGFLETEGNSDEQGMGQSLRGSLGRLQQAQTFDQIVDAMDDITDDLDDITDYCESPDAPATAGGAVVEPSDGPPEASSSTRPRTRPSRRSALLG